MPAERPDVPGPGNGGASRLLEEHGDAIGRVCMAWLGETEAAQAAVEEIFVLALEGLAQRTNEGSLRGWLFGIAQRVCARTLETKMNRTQPLVPPAGNVQRTQPSAETLPSLGGRTRLALAELPPTERDAVVLRFVAGLALEDVAQATRVDVKTARERAGRGIAKLRGHLAEGRGT